MCCQYALNSSFITYLLYITFCWISFLAYPPSGFSEETTCLSTKALQTLSKLALLVNFCKMAFFLAYSFINLHKFTMCSE